MPLTICMALVQRRLPGKCTAQLLGTAGVPSVIACPCSGTTQSWDLGRGAPGVYSMDAEIAKSKAGLANGKMPCGFSPPSIAAILRLRALPSAGVVQW
jgi:hypothetical protein